MVRRGECRVASASLTYGTDFSGTRTRIYKRFEMVQRAQRRRCTNPNDESVRVRNPEKSVPQVNDALASCHSDRPPTEHRMTVTMAPVASSDCTKAYPIASDAPTTSPSHGDTSSVHGESPRPIPETDRRNVMFWSTQACTTPAGCPPPVSYTHLRAHETSLHLVCRLLLEKR